jgi:hypothetical protein
VLYRHHERLRTEPGRAPLSAAERKVPLTACFPDAYNKRQLRSATMIQARTGERVKKTFTLRRSSTSSTEFLLAPGQSDPDRYRELGRMKAFRERCKDTARSAYEFVVSPTGISILKCSLAYILGSLATFVPFIAALLGKNDGKHMVATITVYFHPARSVGSMVEAIILAFAAVLYAAFISFTSMAVSVFFGSQDLLVVGHVIVLVVFIGAGLGLVGWTKQRLGSPLVNVACSLTSLALITVLTKEGAVQAAMFSYNKVWQVLKMVIMGTVASSAVALLIKPRSARNEFRDTFIKANDSMGEMLTSITRSFLSGSEADLKNSAFVKASSESRANYKTLVQNLSEAKYEHYMLGTESEYRIASRLVKCYEQLMQNIGGLRSAAETQFTFLAQPEGENGATKGDVPVLSTRSSSLTENELSPVLAPRPTYSDRRSSILASIDELPESSAEASEDDSSNNKNGSLKLPQDMQSNLTAADMFSVFIAHLGPPMVNLPSHARIAFTNGTRNHSLIPYERFLTSSHLALVRTTRWLSTSIFGTASSTRLHFLSTLGKRHSRWCIATRFQRRQGLSLSLLTSRRWPPVVAISVPRCKILQKTW